VIALLWYGGAAMPHGFSAHCTFAFGTGFRDN
jgi:hypothetical protein